VAKLVENGEVLEEGSHLLAFIDVCVDQGMRWCVAQNTDGSYKVHVLLVEERVTVSGAGATISAAIKDLGKNMIDEGRRGLPLA
jgi:hypothetical protein